MQVGQTCNFCEYLHDVLIRDRIVRGIKSKNLHQERKLMLSKCLDICRSSKAISSQLQAILGTGGKEINKLRQHDSCLKTPWRNKAHNPDRNRKQCKFWCGEHVLKKEKCPFWGSKCLKCRGQTISQRLPRN